MNYRLAADAILLLHLLFILFALFGALLAMRWRWVMLLHLPAATWGFLVEFNGWICPLTPWENALRVQAGESGYSAGYIEHYLLPVIYPAGLTHDIQLLLAWVVVLLNLLLYGWLLWRRRQT